MVTVPLEFIIVLWCNVVAKSPQNVVMGQTHVVAPHSPLSLLYSGMDLGYRTYRARKAMGIHRFYNPFPSDHPGPYNTRVLVVLRQPTYSLIPSSPTLISQPASFRPTVVNVCFISEFWGKGKKLYRYRTLRCCGCWLLPHPTFATYTPQRGGKWEYCSQSHRKPSFPFRYSLAVPQRISMSFRGEQLAEPLSVAPPPTSPIQFTPHHPISPPSYSLFLD